MRENSSAIYNNTGGPQSSKLTTDQNQEPQYATGNIRTAEQLQSRRRLTAGLLQQKLYQNTHKCNVMQ